jgi:prepilin-type N-terminal cleavage/methylation domain-containing protein
MSNRKGFTLIELLIVVVIIGILAAIAIPKFANTKQKAVRSSMISDLRNLATAQEAFYADSTRYAGSYSSTIGSNSVNFAASQNNTLAITTTASGAAWTATVTNTGYNGGSSTCGIFVGTTATVTGATAEGVPGCQ